MLTKYKVLSRKKATFILTLARRIVPEVSALDGREQQELVRIIDDALALREPAVRFQFKLFLTMIRWSSMLRHGRTLERLSSDLQDEMLTEFQESSVPRLGAGMWGLKTLIFMGYYGNLEWWGKIHYTPEMNGNESLHG